VLAVLETGHLELTPGEPATLAIEVTNTLEIIDGISASIDLGDGLHVASDPPVLPLFPEGVGVITLTLTASPTLPAGTHPAVVQLHSAIHPNDITGRDVVLEVAPRPAASLAAVPPVRRGRSDQSYVVVVTNKGNAPITLSLAASDPARAVITEFDPPEVQTEPDGSAVTELRVLARRQWFGNEARRTITIVGTGGGVEEATSAVFHQQPMIPRGVRTALVLACIVALWAVIFVVALDRAFAKDALVKQVPPSYYASASATAPTALSDNVVDGGAPAGAVPKSGVVIGVGGTINGKVTALNTAEGVGRITIEAMQASSSGPVLVSSAASASDGSYSIQGLFPGPYLLQFVAAGYQPLWYPSALDQSGARPVTVNALETTTVKPAVVLGLPGSITGIVDTGQSPAPPVTVTVQAEQGTTRIVATTTTDAAGGYAVAGLPTPGSYDLSFTSAGYGIATDVEQLSGGDARVANTVSLTAGNGSISGTVTDGTSLLGGVGITAVANGRTFTSATPTTGAIGTFTIANLPSPAAYLFTFTKRGFGTQTQVINLGPGQDLTGVALALQGGAGQVSGTVVGPTGAPLGGVTVTVNGAGAPISTQTLTAGQVGTYLLSGLATPGSYTLTFSDAGFTSQTVGVTLASSGSATGVNVTLPQEVGTITGTVSGSGSGPLAGVTVSITDGVNVHTTMSSSIPPGGFSVTGLPPASYSVSFSLTGFVTQTAQVRLSPGATASLTVTLAPAS
jgi:Carboxypeptidase regulatory-like domain